MNNELIQLKEIFENKPIEELSLVLNKANGNLEQAIEYMLLNLKAKNRAKITIDGFIKKNNDAGGRVGKCDDQIGSKKEKENHRETFKEDNKVDLKSESIYEVISSSSNFNNTSNQGVSIIDDEMMAINKNETINQWNSILKEKPKITEQEEISRIQNQIEASKKWSKLLNNASEKQDTVDIKNTKKAKIKPVLYIYDNKLLTKSLPCVTMHPNFLNKKLAMDLFYKLKEQSKQWETYSMYMFERKVESPHTTHPFCSNDEHFPKGNYYFNGNKTNIPTPYCELLKEAAKTVQEFVNQERKKRESHRLDLAPLHEWKTNYGIVNMYTGTKSSVGWHTDRLTYLGPRPIIVSLSLGVTREFRMRKITPDSDKTQYSILLSHNTLLIMWPSSQEEYKHKVPIQNTLTPFPDDNLARICITFRYFPKAFGPQNTPNCFCNKPCDLRVINVDPNNFGKYFYKCVVEEGFGIKGCGFFKYVEFPDYPADNFDLSFVK